MVQAGSTTTRGGKFKAGLDEGLLSLCLPILVYRWNPYRHNKCK
jgi:hypothetical protein